MQSYPLRVSLHPLALRLAPYYALRRQFILYSSAQATGILLSRWHHQRAPEVMLYRSAQGY